jgi:beta-lactamase regulating signal transducer with metallopeptidase domain
VTIGFSLFLIAVGAILRWAVSDNISGVNLSTVGLILLIVGIIGLVISMFMYFNATRARGTYTRTDYTPRDPNDPGTY